jgi:tetratricopeptide (TPR) repeat protein
MKAHPLPLALLLASLVLSSFACIRRVPRSVAESVPSDPAAALPALEALAREHPRDFETLMLLGEAHYRLARQALDRGDEPTYLEHLAPATDAFIAAAARKRGDPSPHIYLAMVAAYRADMPGALQSLRRAQRLAPAEQISYTNLAQVYIYLDDLPRARAMLQRARRLGGPSPYIEINEILEAWKRDDLVDARDLFAGVYASAPEALQTWDEAPVSAPIESFDDFVHYCCSNPSCGPYMRGPCERAHQEIVEREVTLRTLRREIEIAREAREKLGKVYPGDKDKDVSIEVEEPSEDEE